jgi:hypothetical protein
MTSSDKGEQEKKIELTPTEALEHELRQNFESVLLGTGVVYELPQPRNFELGMGSASDMPGGVSQDLRAVIKAGQDFLFIIDTTTRMQSPDYLSGTFLAEFRPGDTSRVLDFSTERSFDGSTIRTLDTRIQWSGMDISVAMSTDGTVGVVDEGSKSRIELFKQKPPETADPNKPDEKPEEQKTLKLRNGSTWQLHTSQVVNAMDWS